MESPVKTTKAVSDDQHIMTDDGLLDRIADTANIKPSDSVLEIGGGPGNLTERLARKGSTLFVVEKDPAFAASLRKKFGENERIRIIEGDILDVHLPKFDKIVANMPYSVVEQFFVRLLKERRYNFDEAIMTVPYSLAMKMTAKPGSAEFGRVSAFFLAFYEVKILFTIGKESYNPRPKVRSECVKITLRRPKTPAEQKANRLLQEIFLCDGKKVKNTITSTLWNNGSALFGNALSKKESKLLVKKAFSGIEFGDKTTVQLTDLEFGRLVAAIESL